MKRFLSRISGRQLARGAFKSLLIVILCMFCLPLAFGMICARPRKFADQTAALFIFALGTVISGPTVMSMLAPFANLLDEVTLSGMDMFRSMGFQLVALFCGFFIVRLSKRAAGRLELRKMSVSRSYAFSTISAGVFVAVWFLLDAERGNIWTSVAETASAIQTADPDEQRALGSLVQRMGGGR